ncbi:MULTISPECIES: carbamoyltransferase family protein [unclassified Chitinophaga]|uniref:carbamoyltransferase family protein n=1 Tax=unclassified Chitinophaga TaxID=2619133 RepID=UPI0030100053
MLVLGLSGSLARIHERHSELREGNFHDAAAALVHNGRLIAAFEEERLNRIKHTNKLPLMAAKACLDICGCSIDQVDYFTFSESEESMNAMLDGFIGRPSGTNAKAFLSDLLQQEFSHKIAPHQIELMEHHYAHAVTAFYPSPFEESLVLTIDGAGGSYTGSVYKGSKNTLSLLHTFNLEQSLGHLYSDVTFMLGFSNFDEYKVMGLAPYGNPATYRKLFDQCYTLLPEGNYLLHHHEMAKLRAVCPARDKMSGFTKIHQDIAAGLQEMLEKIVFHIVKHYTNVTGHTNLCMAGGVALNCTLNGKLVNSGMVQNMFVYPAASDSGLPIGSALATYFKYEINPLRFPLENLYLGSKTGTIETVETSLKRWENLVSFTRTDDPSATAAGLLADGHVIGWVQGRAEFAPRALGNRSILADPRPAANKERINLIVKMREGYRPFAPSVMEEDADEYFELPSNNKELPYMIFVINVRERYRDLLGAVTHVDGSARVQTVSKQHNRRYWDVIRHFKEKTGTPVVLNTSFNNNAEPIVDSVDDAVVSYLTTELDYLVVGDYLVSKKGRTDDLLDTLYLSLPHYTRLLKAETYSWSGEWKTLPAFSMENSFNDKKGKLSAALFQLLSAADGSTTVKDLIAASGADQQQADTMKKEIRDLWNRRMIVLSPA